MHLSHKLEYKLENKKKNVCKLRLEEIRYMKHKSSINVPFICLLLNDSGFATCLCHRIHLSDVQTYHSWRDSANKGSATSTACAVF